MTANKSASAGNENILAAVKALLITHREFSSVSLMVAEPQLAHLGIWNKVKIDLEDPWNNAIGGKPSLKIGARSFAHPSAQITIASKLDYSFGDGLYISEGNQ
jgi:hypothetical protein